MHKITDVNITLWGKNKVSFLANSDINIIVGINGSGKTTLLLEMEKMLSVQYGKESSYIYIPSIDNLLVKDGRKKQNALSQVLDSFIFYNKEGGSLMYYRMSMLDASSSEQSKIRRRIDNFCDVINNLFKETGKRIEIERDKFLIHADGNLLNIGELSSGEKQILLLLLRVFLLEERESIVLIDEPENSLDISWQYKLVDMLVSLNPNAQFFITTHSPSIFGNGWGDKVIYMEDITTKIENPHESN